jgi:hypothetical protein
VSLGKRDEATIGVDEVKTGKIITPGQVHYKTKGEVASIGGRAPRINAVPSEEPEGGPQ